MKSLKNKKILITGAHGFLGNHLVAFLKKRGYKKLILPKSREYDLSRQKSIQVLLKKARPHIVIHLAARVGGIAANQGNPGLYFYQNLVMGTHLMEESRLAKVDKFVSIGTICSYPKFTPVPFKEKNLWNGYPEETNAPYGLAKKMMMVQSQAYRQQYGFNSICLLPVNLYGPGDNFNLLTSHVIPALIRKFVEAKQKGSKKVVIWGDGSASREFFYVEDCVRGICMAMERYQKSDPVNLGIGREIKIKQLVRIMQREIGFKGQIVWDKSKPNGQPRRCLDVSKAKREFGFKANTPLEKGLKRTIQWYISTRG